MQDSWLMRDDPFGCVMLAVDVKSKAQAYVVYALRAMPKRKLFTFDYDPQLTSFKTCGWSALSMHSSGYSTC